ncbi:MAG: MFS transporter [Proteobacteria bacterium]|nr:MFS transporter [Pseudomonadota bacterium]
MDRRALIALLPMIASLMGLGMMSQFYRSMMAVIAPDVTAALALSGKSLSLIAAAFFVAIAAMQLPAGVLVDRFGSRVTIGATVPLAPVGALVFFLSGGAPGLAAGMFLMGVGCSAAFIGAVSVFARWAPPERFGLVFAVWTAMGNVGNLISSAPLALAAEMLGWRGAVLASGLATGLLGLAAVLTIRDAPPGHPYHTRTPEGAGEMLRGLFEVLSTPSLLGVLALQFIGYGAVATLRGLWAGPYLHDVYGLKGVALGNALLAMTVAIIVGALLYGPLDRRFDTRKWVMIPGAAVTVLLLGALAALPGPPLAGVLALLLAFGAIGAFYVLTMPHAKGLFPDRLAGRAMTSVSLAAFSGVAVLQALSGLVLDWAAGSAPVPPEGAYRAVFAFLTVLLVVGLGLYALARDARPSGRR